MINYTRLSVSSVSLKQSQSGDTRHVLNTK